MRHSKQQSGVALVEVLIAIGVIVSIMVVVGFSITTYVEARAKLLSNAKALYLAEEGYEILRATRDEDWNTISALTPGDTYSFAVATTTLAISSTIEVIEGQYYRSFKVEEVDRAGNDDIDLSGGGTVDSGTRLVRVSVFGPSGTTTLEAVLTNIYAL
jgi:type II secretory pathway pseudopilin PulG